MSCKKGKNRSRANRCLSDSVCNKSVSVSVFCRRYVKRNIGVKPIYSIDFLVLGLWYCIHTSSRESRWICLAPGLASVTVAERSIFLRSRATLFDFLFDVVGSPFFLPDQALAHRTRMIQCSVIRSLSFFPVGIDEALNVGGPKQTDRQTNRAFPLLSS
jgi:hypothetical protein